MNKAKEVINLLVKMVFSLKFLGAVVAMVMMYSQHNVEAMVAVVIAYLAVKSIINTSVTLKEGEFEYHFVDDPKINSIICWFLSTKTWIAVMCYFLILKAAGVAMSFSSMSIAFIQVSQGFLPIDKVAGHIEMLGIAFGSAIGLPEVAGFIKGRISIKPYEKPVVQQPAYDMPQPSPIPETSPSAGQAPGYTPLPPEVPFSEADKTLMHELALASAKSQLTYNAGYQTGTVTIQPSKEKIWYEMIKYAGSVKDFPALNLNRVRDCLGYLIQEGKAAYYEQAKHPYGDAINHLGDKNPTCPYTSVKQMARAEGYEDTMNELERLEQLLFSVEKAQDYGRQVRLDYSIMSAAFDCEDSFKPKVVTPSGVHR